jgi:hypothetical protein
MILRYPIMTKTKEGEGRKIRLAHILPKKDLFDSKLNIPLGDESFFKQVVSSLKEWVKTRKPNILLEHRRDGETLGEIVGIHEDEKGIFAEMVLNPDIDQKLQEGKFRFVSPTIAWNHKADDFGAHGTWPAALLEVSMVACPRHSRQIPMTQINELSESRVLNSHVTQLSARIGPTESYFISDTEDINMSLEELQEVMAEMLAPVVERLDALESSSLEEGEEEEVKEEDAEASADEAKVDEDEGQAEGDEERAEVKEEEAELAEDGKEEEEVVELSEKLSDVQTMERRALLAEAKVAELNGVITMRDAQNAVASDLVGRPHMSSMSEKLVNIYVTDRDLYSEVIGVIPADATSILAERVTVGYATGNAKAGNPYKAALALQKAEGINYLEALKRVG